MRLTARSGIKRTECKSKVQTQTWVRNEAFEGVETV